MARELFVFFVWVEELQLLSVEGLLEGIPEEAEDLHHSFQP